MSDDGLKVCAAVSSCVLINGDNILAVQTFLLTCNLKGL